MEMRKNPVFPVCADAMEPERLTALLTWRMRGVTHPSLDIKPACERLSPRIARRIRSLGQDKAEKANGLPRRLSALPPLTKALLTELRWRYLVYCGNRFAAKNLETGAA